jgi:hypothetical protein
MGIAFGDTQIVALGDSVQRPHNCLACFPDRSDECDHRGKGPVRRATMKTFTIETETNNITLNASTKDAEAVSGAQRFSSEAALVKLAANWPAARLVEIWNSLPGATPVRKFTDRKTAVNRIWRAIQNLVQPVAPEGEPEHERSLPSGSAAPEAQQTPNVAAPESSGTHKATRPKQSPKAARKTKGSRDGSKTATVLAFSNARAVPV